MAVASGNAPNSPLQNTPQSTNIINHEQLRTTAKIKRKHRRRRLLTRQHFLLLFSPFLLLIASLSSHDTVIANWLAIDRSIDIRSPETQQCLSE